MILDEGKWKAFVDKPDAITLQGDPAYSYASAFVKNYTTKYAKNYADFVSKNNELGKIVYERNYGDESCGSKENVS